MPFLGLVFVARVGLSFSVKVLAQRPLAGVAYTTIELLHKYRRAGCPLFLAHLDPIPRTAAQHRITRDHSLSNKPSTYMDRWNVFGVGSRVSSSPQNARITDTRCVDLLRRAIVVRHVRLRRRRKLRRRSLRPCLTRRSSPAERR